MNRLYKKTAAVLVAAILVLGLFPVVVTAEAVHTEDVKITEDVQEATPTDLAAAPLGIQPLSTRIVEEGPFIIEIYEGQIYWNGAQATLRIFPGARVKISPRGVAHNRGRIEVFPPERSGTPVTELTLYNLTINGEQSALEVNSPTNLYLVGENRLTGSGDHAGIHVPPGINLTISGGGTLYATGGGDGGAGIGGSRWKNDGRAGHITIESGTITAVGGRDAAGIGGGGSRSPHWGSHGGNVTIRNGHVTAKGGSGSAGIGGGMYGGGGDVTISGGTVVATGEGGGAGIGGGAGLGGTSQPRSGSSGNITISGYAHVTAHVTGNSRGAMSIGSGDRGYSAGTLHVIGNPTIITNAGRAPGPASAAALQTVQYFAYAPAEDPAPAPAPRPEPAPVPNMVIINGSGTVTDPTNPAHVNETINALLAAADDSMSQVTFRLPDNHDTKSINSDSMYALVESGTDLSITSGDVTVIIPTEKLLELHEFVTSFDIRISSTENDYGNMEVSVDFSDFDGRSIGGFDELMRLVVDMTERGAMNPNPHRVVALNRSGMPKGGTYNPRTGLFTVDVAGSTTFTIEMVEELVRLRMSPGSTRKKDLAGNVPNVNMEAAPIIQEGIVLVPVRYVGESLGFGVDWNPDTQEVTLSQEGRTFTFGTDHPQAQLIDDKAFITLEYAGQLFGAFVNWDYDSRVIKVIR